MADPVLTYKIWKAMGPAGTDSISLVDLILDVSLDGESVRNVFTVKLPAPLLGASSLADDDIIFAAKTELTDKQINDVVNSSLSNIEYEKLRKSNELVQRALVEPARVPESVTPRQARLELAKRGLLDNVASIISVIPEPDKSLIEIEWEYAVSIERASPWVIQLGTALGLDEAGLDDLFKEAAAL